MHKYTDAMVAEMKATATFNYETALAFAEKHGLPVRSVVAKARALEIPYAAKVPTSKAKSATAKPSKADLVKSIESLVGTTIASLAKMTVADLETLKVAVTK